MKTLNTYIEERLVLTKNSQYIDIEIFDTFNKNASHNELIVGSILFNKTVKALFYFFNDNSSSQFFFYTDENTYNELYDPEYTKLMHKNGQMGAYPNKEFRNKLNDEISDEGFNKVSDNLIFLRTYPEVEGDWDYWAPVCTTTKEKENWINWIKYYNKISGENLNTNIDNWEFGIL